VTLDSIVVEATSPSSDPLMVEFAANKARGFGRFITRAELDKMEGQTLENVMSQLAGLGIVRGHSGQAWITGKHAPMCWR